MAFLSFIKDRQTQQAVPERQGLEAPKQISSERVQADKSLAQIPETEKAKARDIGSRIEQSGQSIAQNAPVPTQAPSDSASSPEVMRQDMTGRDKSQPSLSPTDGQVANSALQKDAATQSQEVSAKENGTQSPSPARTPQIDRGGWER